MSATEKVSALLALIGNFETKEDKKRKKSPNKKRKLTNYNPINTVNQQQSKRRKINETHSNHTHSSKSSLPSDLQILNTNHDNHHNHNHNHNDSYSQKAGYNLYANGQIPVDTRNAYESPIPFGADRNDSDDNMSLRTFRPRISRKSGDSHLPPRVSPVHKSNSPMSSKMTEAYDRLALLQVDSNTGRRHRRKNKLYHRRKRSTLDGIGKHLSRDGQVLVTDLNKEKYQHLMEETGKKKIDQIKQHMGGNLADFVQGTDARNRNKKKIGIDLTAEDEDEESNDIEILSNEYCIKGARKQRLKEWLTDIVKLPQYFDVFVANDFYLDLMGTVTKDDLKDMGIKSVGHLRTILNHSSQHDVYSTAFDI